MTTPNHPRFRPEECANCRSRKAAPWHLLCDRCFDEVPKVLADELVASCQRQPDSRWHHSAIDAVLHSIEVDSKPWGQP